MQKLLGKIMVMLQKSYSVFNKESKKIEFAIFWFSTTFYEFYKFQQNIFYYLRN
jgi:hypothetical protein